LQPVTYNFDTKKYQNHIMKNLPDSIKSKMLEGKNISNTNVVQTGFLAQDIEKVCKDLKYDFDGLHIPENESDNYSVAYSQFVTPLVKGMQEQQHTISSLKNQNDNLEKRLLAIKEKLDKK
jgi:trimeric autotransporter adhesin